MNNELCLFCNDFVVKSPSSWGHRKWISQKLVENCTSKQEKGTLPASESSDACQSDHLYQWATSEIATCTLVSEKFPKNYYSWTHRLWVCRLLFGSWYDHHDSPSKLCSNDIAKTSLLFQLLNKELSNCTAWMRNHVSDHSAAHYQGQIMRMILAIGLHPGKGCFYHQQSQFIEGLCLAWDLVTNSMESARSSNFLSHEAIWINRRNCGFAFINLLEGCLFVDGSSKDWLVQFDPTPLSAFMDDFITREVIDLFSSYSQLESSLERNNALAYIVWMGNLLKTKVKVLSEDSFVVTEKALTLLGHDNNIVGNAWRLLMEFSQGQGGNN